MNQLKKGLVQIYTGNGKGKSTAAFGLAIRAVGRGMRVKVVQFMKCDKDYGEQIMLRKFGDALSLSCYGSGKWVKKGQASAEDLALAQDALAEVRRAFQEDYDVIIMDELNNALYFELLTVDEVLALLHEKPANVEVVMTGRNAPQELIDVADLVTEMREVKHPYQKGINAREGIEF